MPKLKLSSFTFDYSIIDVIKSDVTFRGEEGVFSKEFIVWIKNRVEPFKFTIGLLEPEYSVEIKKGWLWDSKVSTLVDYTKDEVIQHKAVLKKHLDLYLDALEEVKKWEEYDG